MWVVERDAQCGRLTKIKGQRLLSARTPSPCTDIYTVVWVHVLSLGLIKAWASDINQPPVATSRDCFMMRTMNVGNKKVAVSQLQQR